MLQKRTVFGTPEAGPRKRWQGKPGSVDLPWARLDAGPKLVIMKRAGQVLQTPDRLSPQRDPSYEGNVMAARHSSEVRTRADFNSFHA